MAVYRYRAVRVGANQSTPEVVRKVLDPAGRRGQRVVGVRSGPDGEHVILEETVSSEGGADVVFDGEEALAAADAKMRDNRRRLEDDAAKQRQQQQDAQRAERLLAELSDEERTRLTTEATQHLPERLRRCEPAIRALVHQRVLAADGGRGTTGAPRGARPGSPLLPASR